jgi:cystathionine beta-lyase/cystathionine gamma-synthase
VLISHIIMNKNKLPGFATRAIHVGQEPDLESGAISAPIHPTSTYVQQEIGKNKGYEYARVSNPTRTRLEENLAALEGGIASRVFASGMAAINALCTMYKSGDHVVCGHNLYGGVPRLFNQVLTGYGMEFTYVDTSDVRNVERAIRRKTRMVYVETPTNPLMDLADIEAISKVCRSEKVELVVDNTFMSPYFQQPIALGADMVVHSTTKFLNGHSDGLGGVVVCTKPEQVEELGFVQKAAGAILSPFECWLVLRGVKTLAVRMEQHDRSGRIVAEFLAKHKKVKKVFYPGLPDHPHYALAQPPDDWLRLHDLFRDWLALECQQDAEKSPCLLFGGVAGRSGNSDFASRDHDSRWSGRKGKKTDWHHRWHGQDFRGHRERGRHYRGSRSGARRNLKRSFDPRRDY